MDHRSMQQPMAEGGLKLSTAAWSVEYQSKVILKFQSPHSVLCVSF
jgi:hypothetical protein